MTTTLSFKGKISSAGDKRVLLESHDPEVTSWDIAQYCNASLRGSPEEYHMLVKQGY